MFLKSLGLKGFKSFADATSLEFQPGVCVVVGPNGSGKSNIVDAIGWVLGAQAPSAVRSQKMDDVIFAGTGKRAALGRAEVSLTIDNSAGLLPIEFSEVTLTRTLFRNGDSEYAINDVPCRLLDIQELLSDSGVGRQQHVIISQGQIDGVLNARPEERRLIIEEAAGVLKYRRRKEKAERRLAATEGNLVRVQDLLREVRRQLRPLERQAEAARRHGQVVAELQALRVYLAGREIASLRSRLEKAVAERHELDSAERRFRAELAELDAAVMAAEAELSARGGNDLGDVLSRFEALREKAKGQAALLAERRRGIDRARQAFVDQAVAATLETEAVRLREQLSELEREEADLVPLGARVASAEATLARERASFAERWQEPLPSASRQAAEVRGELAALRSGTDRTTAEASRIRARLAAWAGKSEQLGAELEALRDERQRGQREGERLAAVAEAARAARADAEARQVAADEASRRADAELHRWTARADALQQALDHARAEAGVEALAGVSGVVGTLLDLVEVDEGWEGAFEAAAADAIAAVVVDGVEPARAALGALHDAGVKGAVVPLGTVTGATPLPPPVGQPVRGHVRSERADVERTLDALIGNAVVVDHWSAAIDVVLTHPTAVAVTREGDLLSARGWRVGGAPAGATGAALAEATAAASQAELAAGAAAEAAEAARRTAEVARQAAADHGKAADRHEQRMAAVDQAISRLERQLADGARDAEELQAQLADVSRRAADEASRVAELEALLPELEAAEAEAAQQAEAMAKTRAELEEGAAVLASQRADLDRRRARLVERRGFLEGRLGEVEQRLDRQSVARTEAAARRLDLDRQQVAIDRLALWVRSRQRVIDQELATLREQRRRQSEAAKAAASRLDALREQRAGVERALEAHRERQRRAELEEAELRLRLEQASEAVRRDLDTEPEAAMTAVPPELPEGVTPPARARELERDLRMMGPINPLALEEFEALQERHLFLEGQLDDVKSSRRELSKVIKAIDSEIVSVFASAFADVESNFRQLFETLFPGGSGRLRLTEPDNLLDTGIEVEARPSGKNVRKLSLLSGGERSLTALAFLFAVFRARPSPFYVMDEVEAALDDVNLHRFLDLVAEFRDEAQLIIVSHQKRTMEAADVLYGVTMQPGGSSRVVTERVG